ncbi:glycosyltransferase [Halorhabdus tiamatea]|uniref:Dolichol-P-glucose transferase n=1 Tax=Halorhabdus tiamatea SARL4B TaxID=1033806 RepID=F7PKG1_9EURY|nr:glycosyltransferase [Halorhabdus tiamatea]CCQ34799.1 dolichol-P-glucose transferase [Halorhabdus tiamatea SARL4B]
MSRSVGVVVPAYRPDVPALESYVQTLRSTIDPDALLIELDAASAETAERLRDLPARVNAVPYRRGKGAAITAGFESLDTGVLAFADADGSVPADDFADVLGPVLAERADLAVGSRRHPDANVTSHQTLGRRFLGDGFAWLARRSLEARLYDYQCGAKAISESAWESVREHIFEPGFAWDVELVAIAGALDLRITEVPVTWVDQPGSTVSPVRTSLSLARTLLAARRRAAKLAADRPSAPGSIHRGDESALVYREDI